MELESILSGLEGLKAKGNLKQEISSITSDSRQVQEDGVFVAIKGYDTDGHNYIKQAIEKGAKVIVIEEGVKLQKADVTENTTIISAPNTRIALAKMACNFYGNPSKKLKVVGITGTQGKTTTSFMIKRILEKHGQKVGLIGTIANYIGDKEITGNENNRTTPNSLELQKILSEMVDEKVQTVVMEVSSQSLKLDRVYGMDFDIAVFTNFSEEHLSPKEHPDMEDYWNSKLKLMKMAKKDFINADDFQVAKIKRLLPEKQIQTFGIDNDANSIAKDVTVKKDSVDFRVKVGKKNERINVGIPGRFTVYNAIAAISVANEFEVTADEVKEALIDIKVPGRCELIPNKKGLSIMLDYAHAPASLESILTAVKSYTKGRVISVFGCGGDRDSSKRPIMGEISGRIAGYTIITSDNSRTEKPEKIIEEIENGMKRTKGAYKIIVNREEAIKYAISIANKSDMIIITGKGHETYQEVNGKKTPFDERKIIKKYI